MVWFPQVVGRVFRHAEGVVPTGHVFEYFFLPIYWMQDTLSQWAVLGLLTFVTLSALQVTYAVYAGRKRLRGIWRH